MKEQLLISNNNIKIPATLWGNTKDKLIIAIHGDMSNKEDVVIELLAKNAIDKGYCILSFDLPEHGARKDDESYECNPQNCISDFQMIYSYANALNKEIYLFACSMGAYFSLLAYCESVIKKTFFLSPVVNMEKIIQSMMTRFNVSEQQLKNEQEISLPIGKTLNWDYYLYVREHPINFQWSSPIALLYGSEDTISPREEIESFSRRYNAKLSVLENGEHYFSSEKQLRFFEKWLNENL